MCIQNPITAHTSLLNSDLLLIVDTMAFCSKDWLSLPVEIGQRL